MHIPTSATGRAWAWSASLAVLAGTFVVAPAIPAHAQSETAEIDTIIVSTTRREQNIQDVPNSVAAATGEQVAEFFQAGQDVRALAARVPSLYAESSNGRVAPRFYIRGFGNTDFDLAASQPVSIIMDDVVQENVILKSFPLFDIEQVEISRGPQGTLFGRNTTAGIIKFDSRKPTDHLDGYGMVSYGSFNSVNVEAAVGGPVTPQTPGLLSARLSVLSQNRDDWIDNAFTGEGDALGGYNELAARAQLLFTPTDALSILGNVHSRSLEGTAAVFRANILTPGSNELNENFDRDVVFFDGGDNNQQEYDSTGGSVKVDFTQPSFTVSSITGYETTEGFSRGDIDGGNLETGPGFIPFPSDTQDGIDDLDQFTQELRIATELDGPLNWQVGYYYFDSSFDITTQGPGFPPLTTVRHENDLWALFGQASYDVNDRFTASGGVRFTSDEKRLEALVAPLPTDPVEVSDEKISWDVSGLYRLNEDLSLYGRVARGFRGPTIQGRDIAFFGAPSVAESETNMSIEGGFKSTMLNDAMRLNGSAFYYRVSDQQLSAVGGEGNLVQLVNADKGVGYGVELEAEAYLTNQLLVTAGFSYNKTELQDDNLLVGICAQCTVLDPTVDVDGTLRALVDGNPFPQAPETIFNITARYGVPLGEGELFAYTDWFYQGETNLFLYESAEFNSDGNIEGGLKIGYAGVMPSGHPYEAALFARNITDEENLLGGIDFNNNTGFVNEPRVFGVSLTARLN